MRYEHVDYGDPTINILTVIGVGIVMFLVYLKVAPPWSNIIAVACLWAPLIIFQFASGRNFLGVILILIAGFILKENWNDS
jgi:hypothetical protein